MGNGAKIGLVGVLAAIVLVVAIWDRSGDPHVVDADGLGPLQPAPEQLSDAIAPGSPQSIQPATTHDGDRLVGQIEGNGTLTLPGVTASAPPVSDTATGPADSAPATAASSNAPAPLTPDGPPAVAASATPEVVHPGTSTTESHEGSAPSPAPAATDTADATGALLATYTVKPGDTLSRIAARFYGNGRRYYAIVKANRDRLPNPDVLPLGVELRIPRLENADTVTPRSSRTSTPGTSNPSTGRTYTVQPGDTLYRIARKLLGDGKKYHAIFEANRDRLRNPNDLRVGMQIVIPRG